jgi:hypothetical protein
MPINFKRAMFVTAVDQEARSITFGPANTLTTEMIQNAANIARERGSSRPTNFVENIYRHAGEFRISLSTSFLKQEEQLAFDFYQEKSYKKKHGM